MAIPYNRRQLIQRIKRHIANGFPNDAFATTDNEVSLYIDQAIAFQIKALAFEAAKVDGVLAVPEAFLVTFQLNLSFDQTSRYWFTTLPQPPISLPLGYSITRAFFTKAPFGQGDEILPISAKRVAFRALMPLPTGVRYWVEGLKMWLSANDGSSLQGLTVYVQLPVNRASDLDAPMNMPDDIIEAVFNDVVMQLMKRMQMPKDIVNDDLPAGATNIKTR